MDFKERVAQIAIQYAPIYKQTFVDFEYLICSDCFVNRDYYILSAKEDNYLHLIGVNTPVLSPLEFFNLCMSGELQATDFNFVKKGRSEKEIKGSVRKKIKALPYYADMFNQPLLVQESFVKNSIICSFAATDSSMTIGYINNKKSVPKSLMLGNHVDQTVAAPAELILRRRTHEACFNEVLVGDDKILLKYISKIQAIADF